MDVINHLRIELAEEVASLPEVLRSEFPDLGIDFIYTVFKDSAHDRVPRLPSSALEQAHEAAFAVKKSAPLPSPAPSPAHITAVRSFLDDIEAQCAALQSNAAPRVVGYENLLHQGDDATNDPSEEPSSLVRCDRCNSVMFRSVASLHAKTCLIEPPRSTEIKEDHGRGKSGILGKRQQSEAAPQKALLPPKSKSRKRAGAQGQKSNSSLVLEPSSPETSYLKSYSDVSLSPMLKAAAGARQSRSAADRQRRKNMEFNPYDVVETLVLEAQPREESTSNKVTSPRPGVPMRTASQNTEPHLLRVVARKRGGDVASQGQTRGGASSSGLPVHNNTIPAPPQDRYPVSSQATRVHGDMTYQALPAPVYAASSMQQPFLVQRAPQYAYPGYAHAAVPQLVTSHYHLGLHQGMANHVSSVNSDGAGLYPKVVPDIHRGSELMPPPDRRWVPHQQQDHLAAVQYRTPQGGAPVLQPVLYGIARSSLEPVTTPSIGALYGTFGMK